MKTGQNGMRPHSDFIRTIHKPIKELVTFNEPDHGPQSYQNNIQC